MQLKLLLPEIFSEQAIDFAKFQQLFGDHITTEPDRYMLNWAGKSVAYQTLQTPSFKTLTPCVAESVDFDRTQNVFIEGENLDVLKALQKSYFNSIKMIYIDPPYNTGNDFVYRDDFAQHKAEYAEQVGDIDETGKLKRAFVRNSKENGHYHSNWLNMMLPRLHLARNLLKEDGVIFISIDDNEQAQLKLLCDEVFGEENFVASVIWQRKRGRDNSARWFSKSHEYMMIYSKEKNKFDVNLLNLDAETIKAYKNPDNDPRGNYRMLATWARGTQGGVKYDFTDKNGQYFSERLWLFSKENLSKLDAENKLIIRGDNIYRKLFLTENKGRIPETIWADVSNSANASDEIKALFDGFIYFDTAKPIPYIKQVIHISCDKNDLILDFFAGSGTTAHAVMQLNAEDGGNRRFICVQLPEQVDEKSEAYKAGFSQIADISKERIRRAGSQILQNFEQNRPLAAPPDVGFKVFKLTDSHFKQWQSPSVENLADQLEMFVDSLKTDTDPLAILYEILLRLGLKLTAQLRWENHICWVTNDNGQRFALLLTQADEGIFETALAEKPKKVVVLDSLFNGNDALKKNAELQLQDEGISLLVM